MNTVTPRVFIAATRQNDGKTTTSLGLIAALQKHFPRVGYIKPVGQRFVEIEGHKIDEDTVLIDQTYGIAAPLDAISPIAVEPDFTRRFIQQANTDLLVRRIQKSDGICAMAHLTCVGANRAEIGGVIDRLIDGGIENIIALRGDAPAGQPFAVPADGFAHASDLISFIRDRHDDRRAGS